MNDERELEQSQPEASEIECAREEKSRCDANDAPTVDAQDSPAPDQTASDAPVVNGATENADCAAPKSDAPAKKKRTAKEFFKYYAHRYFIEAFSGMALGLFCTLIIGTIIGQIGILIGDNKVGNIISGIGTTAQLLLGAGIGAGIAHSLKAKKLTSFSAAVAGTIGANISNIFASAGVAIYGATAKAPIVIGDPVGALVATIAAIEVAKYVEGKTPVDIIVVPLTAVLCGTAGAIALGIPFGILFALLGKGVSMAIGWERVSFGILIAVIMGLLLTLPTSSAAFGVMIFKSPLIDTPELLYNAQIGAAAACAGCCAHMVGFAVASFRENKWGGLVSQGLGTSMLQIPNLGKNPRILIPAVAASAVAGPLASAAFGIMCDATGSGMGTAGLVGVIQTFATSIAGGMAWWYVLIAVLVCYIIVPAAVALGVSELMRKKNFIRLGDMKI